MNRSAQADPFQQHQHETAHGKSFPTYQKDQASSTQKLHPQFPQMNSYEFEDDYEFVPDQLTDEEIQEMERLADLHDLEASVPTAQERNPNLK